MDPWGLFMRLDRVGTSIAHHGVKYVLKSNDNLNLIIS